MKVNHYGYVVKDFEGAMEELRGQGFLPISDITKNYKGLQMVFMYNTDIGMIELFEEA